jgi:hypothetical protein
VKTETENLAPDTKGLRIWEGVRGILQLFKTSTYTGRIRGHIRITGYIIKPPIGRISPNMIVRTPIKTADFPLRVPHPR